MKKVLIACAVLAVLLAAPPTVSAPATKRYVFIVMTNPVAGKEAEYNDWYNKVHLPDLLKVPGVKAAHRYVFAKENKPEVSSKYKYLAIYEVETTDLKATQTAMLAMANTPEMVISDALDRTDASAIYFEAVSPRVAAK